MTLKELYNNNSELMDNIIIAGQAIDQFSCMYVDCGTYEMNDIIINCFDNMMQEYNNLNDDGIPVFEFFTEYLKRETEKKYQLKESYK